MADNKPATEIQILRSVEDLIRRALPNNWSVKVIREPGRNRKRPDGSLVLVAPQGERATFVFEAKRSVIAQTLLSAVEQLDTFIEQTDSGALPLIAAGYLSPRSKQVLVERGISYADMTGNLRLLASKPGLFINATGATKDPWPDDQPLRSLRGRGAGRAVRALVDFRPPYGIRELASRAQVPPATLSRVIDLLEREGVIIRDHRGGVTEIDWSAAIRRWSQDYELRRSNFVASYLEPRGQSALIQKLGNAKWRYAATASLAAQRFAPIAATRAAVIYVEDSAEAAKRLKVDFADAGANVFLVEPFDDVVFERKIEREGLISAAPSQLAVDLLTGPGREPSEGEELLDWMKRNEDAWRS